ncbi:MAG: hypothetical protein M1381_05685 [Deltaproteobacteria bacterium]|nr:hypothetical protein [Deltaproteobacteria bacterium]MCL5791793.1 hypothetical protein [Deltaproteobacteria bacterium]
MSLNAKVGDTFTLQKDVDKYRPIFYAGASGDFNPIHIDAEFGKMVGLGGAILQGLCTMAFVMQTVSEWVQDPYKVKRLKVRFAKPVLPEDTVMITGRVTKIENNKAYCELIAKRQTGDEVINNAFTEVDMG